MANIRYFKMIIGLLLGMTAPLCIHSAVLSDRARLMKDLMTNYDPQMLPRLSNDTSVDVTVNFILKNIEGVHWEDELLTWNASEYGGIESIVVDATSLWRPEIAMYNSVESGNDISMDENIRFRARLSANGLVFWAPGFKWRTSCALDLYKFPYDSHNCSVSLVSWVYNMDSMKLLIVPDVMLDTYEPNAEWVLQRVGGSSTQRRVGSSLVPLIHMNMTLSRIPNYYVTTLIVPCMFITCLSVLVFLLPPESGEKISLSITVSLSYTVVLLMVSDLSPRSGETTPYLAQFIITSMTQTFCSLFVTVIIISIHYHSPQTRAPKFIRTCILCCLATCICMTSRKQETETSDRQGQPPPEGINNLKVVDENYPSNGTDPPQLDSDFTSDKNNPYDRNRREWIEIAKVLDRCFLVVFVVLVVVQITVFMLIVMV